MPRAGGGDTETWLRKTVLHYAADGAATKTQVFRYGSVKDDAGKHSHNGWVLVEPKRP